jgi:hypothetical protein
VAAGGGETTASVGLALGLFVFLFFSETLLAHHGPKGTHDTPLP